MNIPDEIMNQAAREFAAELDWEVMSGIMITTGWTKVTVNFGPLMTESQAHEIKEWTREHCKGQIKSRNKTWLFEKSEDAIMFTLRWV